MVYEIPKAYVDAVASYQGPAFRERMEHSSPANRRAMVEEAYKKMVDSNVMAGPTMIDHEPTDFSGKL